MMMIIMIITQVQPRHPAAAEGQGPGRVRSDGGAGQLGRQPHAPGGAHRYHTHIFPKGVVHRVENGWGLTKVAVVLLNGLLC